jgi:hypothetical protein
MKIMDTKKLHKFIALLIIISSPIIYSLNPILKRHSKEWLLFFALSPSVKNQFYYTALLGLCSTCESQENYLGFKSFDVVGILFDS